MGVESEKKEAVYILFAGEESLLVALSELFLFLTGYVTQMGFAINNYRRCSQV